MSDGAFTKLFRRILDSSVWFEDDKTVRVFITLLALAGEDGIAPLLLPALAKRANVTNEECERALDKFQAPDLHSRNQEHEGRRVARVPGGWLLLNHRSFREARAAELRKEQNREASRKYRENKSPSAQNADAVLTGADVSAKSAQEEEEEEEEEEEREGDGRRPSASAPAPVGQTFGPPAQAALALDEPPKLTERPKPQKPKPASKQSALDALRVALSAEMARRNDVAPALPQSLGRLAAQRVADHAKATGGTVERSAAALAASWAERGNGRAWSLTDVPFNTANAARASPVAQRQQREDRDEQLATLGAELMRLKGKRAQYVRHEDEDKRLGIDLEIQGIIAEMRDLKGGN